MHVCTTRAMSTWKDATFLSSQLLETFAQSQMLEASWGLGEMQAGITEGRKGISQGSCILSWKLARELLAADFRGREGPEWTWVITRSAVRPGPCCLSACSACKTCQAPRMKAALYVSVNVIKHTGLPFPCSQGKAADKATFSPA